MQSQLNAEIRQLRGDMLQGFEKVAQCLTLLSSQHSALESRVSQLETRPLERWLSMLRNIITLTTQPISITQTIALTL
jgi:hypothetical protein